MEDEIEVLDIDEFSNKNKLKEGKILKSVIIYDNLLIFESIKYIIIQKYENNEIYIFKALNYCYINDLLHFDKKENCIEIIISFTNKGENEESEKSKIIKGGLKLFQISDNKVKGKIIIEKENIYPYNLFKINNSKIMYSNGEFTYSYSIFNLKSKQIETIIELYEGFSDLEFKYFFRDDFSNFYDVPEFSDGYNNIFISRIKNYEFIYKIYKKNMNKTIKYNFIHYVDDSKINKDELDKGNAQKELDIYIYDNNSQKNIKKSISFKQIFYSYSFLVMSFCKYLINDTFYFVFSLDFGHDYICYYLGKININEKPHILKYHYLNDTNYEFDDIKYMNNKIYYITLSNESRKEVKIINEDDFVVGDLYFS